jgi:hypothetical protein
MFSTVVILIYIPTCSVCGLLSPHILANICCFFLFLVVAILTGVTWNLKVVLISTSFMDSDVEHFFTYFLVHLNFFL